MSNLADDDSRAESCQNWSKLEVQSRKDIPDQIPEEAGWTGEELRQQYQNQFSDLILSLRHLLNIVKTNDLNPRYHNKQFSSGLRSLFINVGSLSIAHFLPYCDNLVPQFSRKWNYFQPFSTPQQMISSFGMLSKAQFQPIL